MPTTNVTASLQGFGSHFSFFASSWSQIRNNTSADTVQTYTSDTDVSGAIIAGFESFRGGGFGVCNRSFVFFDTDSISGTITAATLQVAGVSAGTGSVIPVKSTAWGGSGGSTTFTAAMWNDLTFNTTYGGTISNWNTSGYNTFTLNNNALNAMNNDGYLNVALINQTYDQQNVAPNNNQFDNGIRFRDSTFPIRLVITSADPGYGNNVIGVSNTNIGKVIGVDTGTIETVIGV